MESDLTSEVSSAPRAISRIKRRTIRLDSGRYSQSILCLGTCAHIDLQKFVGQVSLVEGDAQAFFANHRDVVSPDFIGIQTGCFEASKVEMCLRRGEAEIKLNVLHVEGDFCIAQAVVLGILVSVGIIPKQIVFCGAESDREGQGRSVTFKIVCAGMEAFHVASSATIETAAALVGSKAASDLLKHVPVVSAAA